MLCALGTLRGQVTEMVPPVDSIAPQIIYENPEIPVKTLLLPMFLLLTGCFAQQVWVYYSVTSDPTNCSVEANGVFLGKTPCDIKLAYSERWVGLAVAPGGWQRGEESYDVVCSPDSQNSAFYRQASKLIKPALSHLENRGQLHFVLPRSGGAVTGKAPRVPSKATASTGTCFFITADGFCVTSAHVVNGATKITLHTSVGKKNARAVKIDKVNDIAILKVDGKFRPAPLSNRILRLGEDVFTVGYPNPNVQGVSPKVTKGSINSLSGVRDDPRFVQTSTPINPGNSGGALFDKKGIVIGIMTSTLTRVQGEAQQSVNYALRTAYAKMLLRLIPEANKGLLSFERDKLNEKTAIERGLESTALVVAQQNPE